MQRDFHFYCTMVLARAAGFNPDDARIIATASQYVDDSTEYQPIDIKVNGDVLRFDPTCTSYEAINPASLDWANQKRVWIPFHFLPGYLFKIRRSLHFSYITVSDSVFAKFLLQQAVYTPLSNYIFRLVRIGVAIHTYADSFSHAGFSGRHSKENDVRGMSLWKDGKWNESIIKKTILNLAPQIGHAEAGSYPDYSAQKWRCELGKSSQKLERDNALNFLKAAKAIYLYFCKIRKFNSVDLISWEDIEPMIVKLFKMKSLDVEKKCGKWRKEFNSLFPVESDLFFYNKTKLREEALSGDSDWDDFSKRDWLREPTRKLKENFQKSLWVLFHKAALHQRHLVLENIP
jgi:uncharacterized protein DUF6765